MSDKQEVKSYKWLVFSALFLVIVVVVLIAFSGRIKLREVSDYVSTPSTSPIGSSPSEQVKPVKLVVADLASRLQVSESSVQVISVEKAEWSDSSLGLPKPGYVYTQVVTSGYKVVLRVQGNNYIYHTDLENRFAEETLK